MTVTKTSIIISAISDFAESGMILGFHRQECNPLGEIIPQDWLGAGKPDVNYVQ